MSLLQSHQTKERAQARREWSLREFSFPILCGAAIGGRNFRMEKAMKIEVGDYVSAVRKDVRPEVRVSGVLIASSAQGYTVALLDAEGQMAIAKCFLRHVLQIARRPVDTPDWQRDGDDLSDFDEVTRDFIDRARSSLDIIGHFGWDFAAAYQALALRGAFYPEFRDALLKEGRPRKTVRVRRIDAMSLRYPGSFGSGKRR